MSTSLSLSPFFIDLDEAKKKIIYEFGSLDQFIFSLDSSDLIENGTYFLSNNLNPVQCLELIKKKSALKIIQNSVHSLDQKFKFIKTLIGQDINFFNTDLNILFSENFQFSFDKFSDRDKIIEESFNQLELDTKASKNLPLYQVTNELLMNAQIDAPSLSKLITDEDHRSIPRSILKIERDLNLGLIVVTVIDFYGTLDMYKMIDNIYAAHKNGYRESMSQNSHGAGLGSAMIFEHSDSLLIGSIKNKVSRVSVILPYFLSVKKTALMQKSIYLFTNQKKDLHV